MEKSHGGDKNDGFALTAYLVRAHLHFLDGSYNFDGIHLKNLSPNKPAPKMLSWTCGQDGSNIF
jgi:hypothetical protein